MQAELKHESKINTTKANWRSIMIKKDKDTRSKLWKANHKVMVQALRKKICQQDPNYIDPKIITQFKLAAHSRCSLRSRLMVQLARVQEDLDQCDRAKQKIMKRLSDKNAVEYIKSLDEVHDDLDKFEAKNEIIRINHQFDYREPPHFVCEDNTPVCDLFQGNRTWFRDNFGCGVGRSFLQLFNLDFNNG